MVYCLPKQQNVSQIRHKSIFVVFVECVGLYPTNMKTADNQVIISCFVYPAPIHNRDNIVYPKEDKYL